MFLNFLMLLLLVLLFVLCAGLVRFADGVVNPQSERRNQTTT